MLLAYVLIQSAHSLYVLTHRVEGMRPLRYLIVGQVATKLFYLIQFQE